MPLSAAILLAVIVAVSREWQECDRDAGSRVRGDVGGGGTRACIGQFGRLAKEAIANVGGLLSALHPDALFQHQFVRAAEAIEEDGQTVFEGEGLQRSEEHTSEL